jgi:hypothetical protein
MVREAGGNNIMAAGSYLCSYSKKLRRKKKRRKNMRKAAFLRHRSYQALPQNDRPGSRGHIGVHRALLLALDVAPPPPRTQICCIFLC